MPSVRLRFPVPPGHDAEAYARDMEGAEVPMTVERGEPPVATTWRNVMVDEVRVTGGPRYVSVDVDVPEWLASVLSADVGDVSIYGPSRVAPGSGEPTPVAGYAEWVRAFGPPDSDERERMAALFVVGPGPMDLPPGELTGEPAFTVDRYGSTFSITRVPRMGFRTRLRVQWARGIARALWRLPAWFMAGLESEFDTMRYEDRIRVCPHPAEDCYRPDGWDPEEGWICRSCSGVTMDPWPGSIP